MINYLINCDQLVVLELIFTHLVQKILSFNGVKPFICRSCVIVNSFVQCEAIDSVSEGSHRPVLLQADGSPCLALGPYTAVLVYP